MFKTTMARVAAVSGACVCLVLAGCDSGKKTAAATGEDEAMCKQVKPGVVTSVNHYCVIMPDDPVNPAVVREFKGQKVGFCCKGCLGKWDAMSDRQKSEALSIAIAKGKPN